MHDCQQKDSCNADPVHGMPTSWGTKIRTGGLAVILLRAGLKIDKLAFARAGKVVLRLALVPMLCEALVDGGCYYWSVVHIVSHYIAFPLCLATWAACRQVLLSAHAELFVVMTGALRGFVHYATAI